MFTCDCFSTIFLEEVLRDAGATTVAARDSVRETGKPELLIALAMIVIMLMRPRGLWPSPEHGKSLQVKEDV
jgi:branched-chain amino acid transport system permease protein